jgi:long-chain acyl-CoA synthetase
VLRQIFAKRLTRMITAKTYFSGAINQFLDNDLLCDTTGTRFKYSNVNDFCKSTFFQALERKLVVCKLTNEAECLALYFALLASGAIPLLASSDISEQDYSKLLHAYQPAAELIPLAGSAVHGECFRHDSIRKYTVHILKNSSFKYLANDQLALLLPTSGSTGSVKYVRISHENIISNTKAISAYLKIKESDRVITTLPANYSYGASVLHTHLSKGSSIITTKASFFDNKFWNLFKDHKITTLNGVPFHYEMLKRLNFHKKNFPDLRIMTQAGGVLNSEVKSCFINYSIENCISFFVMYGQTEASPRISYISIPDLLEAPDSIGLGLDGCRLFLRNEDGNIISAPHIIGELNVVGPNIAMGYAHSYKDLASVNKFQGSLKTGDLAYYDEQKRFYIVGRISRFVKIVGRRLSLDELQLYVSEYGFDNVCTGDDVLVKVGCVDISPKEQKLLKKKLITKFSMPNNALKIFRIEKIERTSSGKIAYAKNDKK